MIITHTKGRGKKIHLHLDGEYQITTDIDFWAEHFIKDGTDIDEDEWQNLVEKINVKKAVNKCYDLLSRRDHSIKELRTKLLRTVDENSAEIAINRMIEYGYLDDEKFAKVLIKHLRDDKKMSSSFIKKEMYARGISSDIINELFEEEEIDNTSSVCELILTKYARKLTQEGGKDKVFAALMRKGFSYSDIKEAFYLIENEEYQQ
ncbi:MAG: regulatory protein RecX [Ruminococcaceae bacterium]|jgi:regulatory protein|nr:regulatory protein RecX [Oscillospiraceae bacterium]